MPIITPEFNGVNLDQRRSSAIVPADTYSRPPAIDEMPSKNAQLFARAAEQLGSSMVDTAAIYKRVREKQDLERVDDTVASIQNDIKSGKYKDAQSNPLLAELSPVAMMRVHEALGRQDASSALGSINEEFAKSGAINNPEATKAFIAEQEAKASELAASRPGWGGAYYKTVSNGLAALDQHATAHRASEYQRIQLQDFTDGWASTVLGTYDEHTPKPTLEPGASTFAFNNGKVVGKTNLPTVLAASNDANAAKLIAHFEGYKDKAYWDVNHHRVGFGSDTITLPDGTVKTVQKGDTVTREDAERDLTRRTKEFQTGIVKDIGQDAWEKLSPGAKFALTSFAYNYGAGWASKAPSVAAAARSGDPEALGAAIFSRRGDNNGVNSKRRSQEAEIASGNSDIATVAARNAGMTYDNDWKASSIDNFNRRNAMAARAVDHAVATGDTRLIKAFPSELMTPTIEDAFSKASKSADDLQWTRQQRQHELDRQDKLKTHETLLNAVDEKILKGAELNPGVDARRPDGTIDHVVKDYIVNHNLNDQNIPTTESYANSANLADKIESAAAANDYGKLDSEWNGKKPELPELRAWINKQDGIRSTDKIALNKKLDKIIATGQVVDSPDAKSMFKYRVNTYAEVLMQNMMTRVINGVASNPVDFKGEAKSFFDNEVRQRMKEASQIEGPVNKRILLEEAANATKLHLKDISDALTKGEAPSAKPATEAKPVVTQMGGKQFKIEKGADGIVRRVPVN